MAAVQCDNFVGNAWKKDLCLNCFKSKEEHVARNGYLQSIIQTRIPDPPKEVSVLVVSFPPLKMFTFS